MNLFARLFKYRATEGKSPQEDFLTEALAGVLESSLGLRKAFAMWVLGPDSEVLQIQDVRVETQKFAEGFGKFDLWLEVDEERSSVRHVVLFENKIGAPEGKGQLNRYERYLRERCSQAETRTLVYLTPHTRSDFRPEDEVVNFRGLRWFEVFDWMKDWRHRPKADQRGKVLAGELLALLEEWNMDTNLSVSDLAAAVAYRTRVETRLHQILNEVWAACTVEGSKQNQWSYDYRHLWYRSPRIGAGEDLYLEFGFDFASKEEHWNVQSLGLPSAYFALWGAGVEQLPSLPYAWNSPPDSWGWTSKAKVKRMDVVEVKGDSLHSAYLTFFKEALEEAEKAARIG